MAFATFVTVFFYLSVPFVASAVMRGLSGTTATLRAGVQGAMQTAGIMVGAGLTAAGAAATFGGSAAAQAAIEGTKTADRRANRWRLRGRGRVRISRSGFRRLRSSRTAAACAGHRWRKVTKPVQSCPDRSPNRTGFVHRKGLRARDDFAPQGQHLSRLTPPRPRSIRIALRRSKGPPPLPTQQTRNEILRSRSHHEQSRCSQVLDDPYHPVCRHGGCLATISRSWQCALARRS